MGGHAHEPPHRVARAPEVLRLAVRCAVLLHAAKYRPETMAALGLLGSCLSFPTQEMYDMHLVRVLVYLARTRSLGVTYSKHADNAGKLRAFADSNWAVTRSTTGYTSMLAGAGIGSVSRRQHCISMSSCEAELNALAECAIELLHVSAMSHSLTMCRIPPSSASPTTRPPMTSAIDSRQRRTHATSTVRCLRCASCAAPALSPLHM